MPLASILIPTYNQAEYLAEAIQSALDQDYGDLEIIVSDDASTDSTETVIKSFLPNPKLSVNRNASNLGRVGNYRKCLYDLANGDWVLVLDGDDYLCNRSYISNALAVAYRDPATDLVFANAARLRDDIDRQIQNSHENQGLPELIEGRDLFLLLATEKISLFHNTCLYKRQKAIDTGFYQQDIISSDWESLHRYILTGKVAFRHANVAVWRLHDQNATKDMAAQERIDNLLSMFNPYIEAKKHRYFEDDLLEAWLDKRLWNTALKDTCALLKSGDITGYRKYMARLKTLRPVIFQRLRRSPKLIIKRLTTLVRNRNG